MDTKVDETYRSPNAIEWALLKKLLGKSFPGRDELVGQLDSLSVKPIDTEGSLSLRPSPLAAPAPVEERVVSEGNYSDEDADLSEGSHVNVLLYVVKGLLAELEIYKDDGSPIKKGPLAESLIFY
ncbi:MAG: hypothetical protein WAV72_12460 [Bradyrhizobium sp.]